MGITQGMEKRKAKQAYICYVLSITLEVIQEYIWNQECKAANIVLKAIYNLTEKNSTGVKNGALFGCVLMDVFGPC